MAVDYGKMIRFTAIMKRLIKNCKLSVKEKIRGQITAAELTESENFIIRVIQNEAFTANDPTLNNMDLIYDEYQVLKVKTRILRREDVESFKTPILLPSKHPVVRSIIQ